MNSLSSWRSRDSGAAPVTRIVGGSARGMRLKVPDAGTRPTSDRAREAVFSSVESMRGPWSGARVLDLYAGSGACGLEAASRGAIGVDLVESSRHATRVIELNRDALAPAVPHASVVVHQVPVERWVGRLADHTTGEYDVVFCDPPYATPDASVRLVLDALSRSGALAPQGLVVVERSARGEAWSFSDPMRPRWDRRYGEAHLWIAGLDA